MAFIGSLVTQAIAHAMEPVTLLFNQLATTIRSTSNLPSTLAVESSTNAPDSVPDANSAPLALLSGSLESKQGSFANLVPESTRQKISNGEYADFQTLMPQNLMGGSTELSLILTEQGTTKVKHSQRFKLNSSARWQDAFDVFSSILIPAHPELAHVLSRYSTFIRHKAREYPSSMAWLRYDCLFRHGLAETRSFEYGTVRLSARFAVFCRT